MSSEIPDNISYEDAVVIPMGCSTAASALFQASFLNLQLPTKPKPKPTGTTLLIWGGSYSVGCNAIQLAVAAGYEVITTASSQNFELVKKLGASLAFDYKSPSVNEELVHAFKGKTIVGAFDCIGGQDWSACLAVVHRSNGIKFVATTKRGFPDPPEKVNIKPIFGTAIKDNHVGRAVYEDVLPRALKTGSFVPAPEPLVVGKGLEYVQAAIDLHSKGVSAKKIDFPL